VSSGWRIHLSPPDVGPAERAALLAAFDSGWIAPLGPQVDRFEADLAAAGVGDGDDVLIPSLTFIATANAAVYLGARPVFVDSETTSWNLDPALVLDELDRRARTGRLPAAVVTVDLYGITADHDPIVARCRELAVPVIEDASEALGATYHDRPAGSLADIGVLSFNGNKMITTSGGGALLADADTAVRARWLASQAREPAPHYEHREIGHNYRMSNLLAGLGTAQLARLPHLLAARAAVADRYRAGLAGLPGVTFMPDAPWGTPNHWLTVIQIDPTVAAADHEAVRLALAGHGIEARPAWKPMHRQPVFADAPLVGSGKVADAVFERGLCLPSGSTLQPAEQDEVIAHVRATLTGRPA